MATATERFISLAQTADKVGLSRWTIARWQREGKFPRSFPLENRRVAFRESDILAWMKAHSEQAVPS
jgi:prophage regulatory protein